MPDPGTRSGGLAALARSLPVRLAVTGLLLALLASQVDWDTIDERIRGGHAKWLVAAVLAVLGGLVVGAERWLALLRSARVPASRATVLRGYFIGAFANNFLPTGFGGDAVRALVVAPPGPMLARAASTVIVDRLTALACLLALGWLALPFDAGAVPRELIVGLAIGTAAALATGALVLLTATSRRVRARVPDRLRGVLGEMWAPLRTLAGDPRLIVRVTALGLAYQALILVSVWCGARAIGLELPFALVAVTVPLVLLLTLLPITVAGFGVREGGFAVLLGTAGVSATDATLLSLITVLTMAVASLPGAVAIVARRGRRVRYDSDA